MALHYNYEICWRNYRGLRDTGWLQLRPLTILLGPNNSGKSSIFGPLLLMSQTLAARDSRTAIVTRGPTINVGAYKEFVHQHRDAEDVFFGFRFHTHPPPAKIDDKAIYPPGVLELTLGAGDEQQETCLKDFRILDIYKRQMLRRRLRLDGKYSLQQRNLAPLKGREARAIREDYPFNFAFSPTTALGSFDDDSEPDAKASKNPFSREFQEYLRCVGFTYDFLRNIFGSLSYIGPLRERPRRYYENSGSIPSTVGIRGQQTANLIKRRHEEFQVELDSWVRRFEFGDSLRVKSWSDDLFSLMFADERPRSVTNLADVGFGASQVLPLIVQALAARRSSLMIAEQPEIHLNPRLQGVLADLFVDMAKTDRRVVVETHSEHLLLRLRTLIANGTINPDLVALYFVEKAGTISSVREIPIEPNGHIRAGDWPHGFFEDGLKLSLALASEQAKASAKPRAKAKGNGK